MNSSYSMLVGSDALETDPITGKLLYVPMSGLTAALQARVARTTQPWFPIAGLNRGLLGIPDVRLSFRDADAGLLTSNQVSYARKFAGSGIAFWEANTLYTKNSALQFLNIRVLCNIIKRAVYNYLAYGLQEPGDDILRKQLEYSLDDYLRLVQSGRGIRSYKVVISDVNNSSSLANSGILRVALVIVPIIAVREIQLTLAISKQGLEVSETEIASWAA
jgi:phage tail sheath protein FI